jgi:hypothetical protein
MTSKHDWRSRIEFRVANLERLAAIEKEKGSDQREHNYQALLLWTRPEVWQTGLDPLAQHKLATILDQLNQLVRASRDGERIPRPGEPA